MVFCDLSHECGASGLAFIDSCSRLPHLDLTYVGIAPVEEGETVTRGLFAQPPYDRYACDIYPRLAAVRNEFWNAHAMVPELIIFNMSNLFDRIAPAEARGLALQINQLMHARPQNHYLLLFRDDAGTRMNLHSYHAFTAHLSQVLRPWNEQMPFQGRFYYQQGGGNRPESEAYVYEIRSNRS